MYSGKIVCVVETLPSALSEEELPNPWFNIGLRGGWEWDMRAKYAVISTRGANCELKKCLKDKTITSPTIVYHPTNCTCRFYLLVQPIFVAFRVPLEIELETQIHVIMWYAYSPADAFCWSIASAQSCPLVN